MKSLLIHIHKTFNLLLIISNIFVVCENSGYGSGDIIEQQVILEAVFFPPAPAPALIAPPAIFIENEFIIVQPSQYEVEVLLTPDSQYKIEVLLTPVTPDSQHGFEATVNQVRSCGYPAYCDHSMCRLLNVTSDPIYNCEKGIGIYVFVCVVFVLSLVIVLGNSLLPVVVWQNKDMRTRYNYIKGK